MGTIELQKEIKIILAKLDWSQKRLGREVYMAKFDHDNDDEIRQYEEKIKKDLSRPTTKPELLNSYLDIISQHRDFEKLDVVLPTYYKSDILEGPVEKGLGDISKMVSQLVEEEF